jgi:hypothetical protein
MSGLLMWMLAQSCAKLCTLGKGCEDVSVNLVNIMLTL